MYKNPLTSAAKLSATIMTNYVIEEYERIAMKYIAFRLGKGMNISRKKTLLNQTNSSRMQNLKRNQINNLATYVYDLYTGSNAIWPHSIQQTEELTLSIIRRLGNSLNLRPTGNLPTAEDKSTDPEK